uniref:RNA_pol_L_2 domain-containing protein n=1 Tax=Steinernema glaseri TaxID=37863 RepID=A0A1I7XXH8_9BILA
MSSSLLQPSLVSQKVEILNPNDYLNDQTCLTVILHEEDHTIGNSVKHIMCQMEGVEFCGYNIPHPLEDKILLRVQTKEGFNAATILLEALDNLAASFRKISEKFEDAHAEFQS